MKRLPAALALFAAIAGVAVLYLWQDYRGYLDTPLPLPEDGLLFELRQGTTLRGLAHELAEQGIVKRPRYLEWHARRAGIAAGLRAGEYRLDPGLTPATMLALFASGRTVQYSLTIPEGWTFRQMMAAIGMHERIVRTLDPEDPAGIMAAIGSPDRHPEGWFYPDTYHFPKGTTDLDFLRRAHGRMKEVLDREWGARRPGLPLETPYEALILASIVEKETGAVEERPLIAAVFVSRLERGMRLQTDPTVIYGVEDFAGRIRYRDLRTDTPYNTYTRAGLPPTPIALPGGAAIHAALNPADSKALFFVSRGDGTHHFSETYEEHRQAVIRYQLGGDASRYRGGGG